MKALLITKENRQQIVLTPENDFEKGIVKLFGEGSKAAEIYLGEFYDCQGGWTRQGLSKNSLIVVFDKKD